MQTHEALFATAAILTGLALAFAMATEGAGWDKRGAYAFLGWIAFITAITCALTGVWIQVA